MEKTCEIIGTDVNLTARKLAEGLNIGENTVWRILTEDMGKKPLYKLRQKSDGTFEKN